MSAPLREPMHRLDGDLASLLGGLSLTDSPERRGPQNLIDRRPRELFRDLCYALEAKLPRNEAGADAFSRYATRGWAASDYSIPGFARKYVSNKFESRSRAIYEMLETLGSQYRLDLSGAKIIDVGSGPGCGAAGAAKFFVDQSLGDARVTLVDPADVWSCAVPILSSNGIRARFECKGLEELWDAVYFARHSAFVLIVSHVLADFGGDGEARGRWWESLARALDGKRAAVLVLERSPCDGLIPERIEGGGRLVRFASTFPAGTDDTSHGAVVLLPGGAWATPPSDAPRSGTRRQPAQPPQVAGPPSCPDCGGPMQLRTNRRGYNPGSKFWGCLNFPTCHGKRRM